jgi:hypothetical protein
MFSFIANLFSYHPACGYAAIVGGITWIIITLPSIAVDNTVLMLQRVLYRLVLTVGGVIASLLVSGLMFPSFSSKDMRKSFSQSVTICTQLVVDGIHGVVNGLPFQEDGLNRLSAQTSVESFRGAGQVALRSLQKFISKLSMVCLESRAEIRFINSNTLGTLIKSEKNLYKLIDTVLVLVATAATTRTSRHAHELFFNETVVAAMKHFAITLELAGTKLSSILHGDDTHCLEDCYVSAELDAVERNLMAVRQMLGETRKLHEAVLGGSSLIYVFLFVLGEMAHNWDEFVRGLCDDGKLLSHDHDRCTRVSSSISHMNIF